MKPLGRRARWAVLVVLAVQVIGARAAAEASEFSQLPALRPPRAQLPPAFWEQHRMWFFTGGGLLLAGTVALAWYLRRPLPAPVTPPALQAQRDIEAISQEPDTGLMLSHLSQTTRRYLVQVFGLPGQEMTTREFVAALRATGNIDTPLAQRLAGFLQGCDERKFASDPPAERSDPVTEALQLIEVSEKRLEELRQAAETGKAHERQP